MKPHIWSVSREETMMPDVRFWRCSGCGSTMASATTPRDEGGLVSVDNPWIPHPTDFVMMSADCDVMIARSVLES